MDKLKLELDELRVESFEADAARGGIRGQDENPTNSEPSICRTCPGDPTCHALDGC
ncbi:MAG: hypothetical protein ACJ8J0_17210 [Longimicrobiaceae bacterium]|jgi:hypothetical protein